MMTQAPGFKQLLFSMTRCLHPGQGLCRVLLEVHDPGLYSMICHTAEENEEKYGYII
jgi:hypothetical protein